METDYRHHTAEDFALDEKFQRWVLTADPELQQHWSAWMYQYPAQRDAINRAIELIRSAGLTTDPVANEAFLHVWSKVRTALHTK